VQLFLEGKPSELEARLTERMERAAENMQFELAAKLRDQLITISQAQDRQRIAGTDDEDADVFGFHYENDMLAVNLFHMRGGKIVDRREMFWEELPDFTAMEFSAPELAARRRRLEVEPSLEPDPAWWRRRLTKDGAESEQVSVLEPMDEAKPAVFLCGDVLLCPAEAAVSGSVVCAEAYLCAGGFSGSALLADALREKIGHKIEIAAPQRGERRSLVDLVCQNAKQSYDQRFRVLKPSIQKMQEALQDALMLAEPPERIECFDISHIQGADTVASMVVWEKGAMKKSDYRKFQVKTVTGVDDFASMREIIHRRYLRLQQDEKPMPSLVLIDGGIGQLHAAAAALEEIG
jgi:excinuclease ABC subunit C